MKIKLDSGAKMPTRAHAYDAGLDLYSMVDANLWPHGQMNFDTGVHVEIPEGYVGFIKSKSGLMSKHKITTDGTIDCGYTGSIQVTLFNHGGERYRIKKGDKIAQLVVQPILLPELELVEELEDTERGDGGFGSTGR